MTSLHWVDLLRVLLFSTILAIVAQARDISLQWAICDKDAATVLSKLNHADLEPYKSNPIVYYDTWPPKYTRHGIAFRTKVKHHDPGYPISLIKARFGEYNEDVPSEASCVWDRYGNDTTYTCGLSSILSAIGGEEGESVWSTEQREFAEKYGHIKWNDLIPFGPYQNPKWKLHLLGMKAVFDDVRAAPLHLMELEVAVDTESGQKTYDKIDKHLRETDVVLCEKQVPKTLRLLKLLGDEPEDNNIHESSQIVLGAR